MFLMMDLLPLSLLQWHMCWSYCLSAGEERRRSHASVYNDTWCSCSIPRDWHWWVINLPWQTWILTQWQNRNIIEISNFFFFVFSLVQVQSYWIMFLKCAPSKTCVRYTCTFRQTTKMRSSSTRSLGLRSQTPYKTITSTSSQEIAMLSPSPLLNLKPAIERRYTTWGSHSSPSLFV